MSEIIWYPENILEMKPDRLQQSMSDAEKSPRLKMSWRSAVAGSSWAAFFGWLVLNIVPLAYFVFKTPMNEKGYIILPVFSGLFVSVVWFAVLLPLYHEVPLTSPFWRWPICTLVGAISGWVVMDVFFAISTPHVAGSSDWVRIIFLNPLNWYAALCGGSIGLFGGLTAKYFYANRTR